MGGVEEEGDDHFLEGTEFGGLGGGFSGVRVLEVGTEERGGEGRRRGRERREEGGEERSRRARKGRGEKRRKGGRDNVQSTIRKRLIGTVVR